MKAISNFGRSWLRFSLRTLMVVMFVSCLLSGWVAFLFRQGRAEQDAAVKIEKLGGTAMNCHLLPSSNGISLFPEWMQKIFGIQDYKTINYVTFGNHELSEEDHEITDKEFAIVQVMTDLRSLSLFQTKISDEGLVVLQSLSRLEYFSAEGANITDRGVTHISKLKMLSQLDLSSTKITDAGVAELRKLSNLYDLSLNDTQITDAGILELQRLTNLRHLQVEGTRITEIGLEGLKKVLPNLEICK